MASDLWSSARLIYRGMEPDDDELLLKLQTDPEIFLDVDSGVPSTLNTNSPHKTRQDPKLLIACSC